MFEGNLKGYRIGQRNEVYPPGIGEGYPGYDYYHALQMKQTQEKNPELSMGEVGDIMAQRLQSYSWDFVEEMIWYAMDYVDRCNRDGKDIPEMLRVVARILEARDEPIGF